jgi:hypothetical protein
VAETTPAWDEPIGSYLRIAQENAAAADVADRDGRTDDSVRAGIEASVFAAAAADVAMNFFISWRLAGVAHPGLADFFGEVLNSREPLDMDAPPDLDIFHNALARTARRNTDTKLDLVTKYAAGPGAPALRALRDDVKKMMDYRNRVLHGSVEYMDAEQTRLYTTGHAYKTEFGELAHTVVIPSPGKPFAAMLAVAKPAGESAALAVRHVETSIAFLRAMNAGGVPLAREAE